jgi:anti-sigma regulatory factor (Ser/Thr protein kinase)
MGALVVPQNQSKTFTVDARTVLQLGRQSIKDHTTAVVELVKNCYDADATRVEVEILQNVDEPYIRIADNGIGMSEGAIDRRWLRIGYSEKLAQPVSVRKRRKTGEKGVGRISADRLGATLRLRRKRSNCKSTGIASMFPDRISHRCRCFSDAEFHLFCQRVGAYLATRAQNSGLPHCASLGRSMIYALCMRSCPI